jgi:hypothetical protein
MIFQFEDGGYRAVLVLLFPFAFSLRYEPATQLRLRILVLFTLYRLVADGYAVIGLIIRRG